MKDDWAPGIQAKNLRAGEKPARPRGHAKVQRFFTKLTNDQVLDFIAALEKTLSVTGMAPGPLRETMVRFAREQP